MSAANGSSETRSRRGKAEGRGVAAQQEGRSPNCKVDHTETRANFDWARHGTIATHSYRGYYDAQQVSTTTCAFCGRVIRYCYALHDQHEKTFVIGSCDFHHYKGTKTYEYLKAAQLLQEWNAARLGENSEKENAKW
jgi:hypothetical protein